jgi:hypothetical protein
MLFHIIANTRVSPIPQEQRNYSHMEGNDIIMAMKWMNNEYVFNSTTRVKELQQDEYKCRRW